MNHVFEHLPEFTNGRWRYHMLKESDAADLQDLYDYPLSMMNAQAMIGHLNHSFAEKEEMIVGAYLDEDQQLKCVIEAYHFENDKCNIGYRCCRAERNRGYMTECLKPVLDYLHQNGISVIFAEVNKMNSASICVLKKNGFIFTDRMCDNLEYKLLF